MKTVKTTMIAISLLGASAVYAADECPSYLPAELMQDCIVEQGAGGTYNAEQQYQEWRKAQADKLEAQEEYSYNAPSSVVQN